MYYYPLLLLYCLQCLLLHQAAIGSEGIQRLHGLQGWNTVSLASYQLFQLTI